jgi:hypothetical protein
MFGRWKNGFEDSDGRLICVGKSTKPGVTDHLYVDSNGNGRIDDEKPVLADRRQSSGATFPPVKLTFKGEDGPISYHLIMRMYQFDRERTRLLLGGGGWYEGEVDFGGKKHRIQLVDTTLNGLFNDRDTDSDKCDTVMIGGERGQRRYLGEMLEVGGQLYKVEVARDGAFMKVRKAEGVQLGTVRVPEGVTSFSAVGKLGHFTRKPDQGALKLPVGDYRVEDYELKRKDDKNVEWKLTGRGFGKSAEFAVSAEAPARVDVGEPVRAIVDATEEKGRIQFGLKLRGNLGETVDLMKGNQQPRAPQLLVASARGDYRSTNTFEYG